MTVFCLQTEHMGARKTKVTCLQTIRKQHGGIFFDEYRTSQRQWVRRASLPGTLSSMWHWACRVVRCTEKRWYNWKWTAVVLLASREVPRVTCQRRVPAYMPKACPGKNARRNKKEAACTKNSGEGHGQSEVSIRLCVVSDKKNGDIALKSRYLPASLIEFCISPLLNLPTSPFLSRRTRRRRKIEGIFLRGRRKL